MENRENRNPDQESDISKSQSAQQPQGQAGQQPPSGEKGNQQFGQPNPAESGEQGQQAELGEDRAAGSPDEGLQGDTLSQQRTDVEGQSQPRERGEAESGFVGSKGEADDSAELIEDDDFAKGGQGAPEGK